MLEQQRKEQERRVEEQLGAYSAGTFIEDRYHLVSLPEVLEAPPPFQAWNQFVPLPGAAESCFVPTLDHLC